MSAGAYAVDVAVVGAGFAGLSAARKISRHGLRVAVLEARDRVGGRTLTRVLSDGTQIDLGGQWIGPTQHNIHRLVEEYGIATYPTPAEGNKLLVYGDRRLAGTPESVRQLLAELDRLSAQIPLNAPWRHIFAEYWDRKTFASWLDEQKVPREAKRYTERLIAGGLLAGDAGDFSLLETLFYVASGGGTASLIDCEGGAQDCRMAGGPPVVAKAMAAELGDSIRLGEPVRQIEHHENGAVVITDKWIYEAGRVIVAIPPTLAGRIEYTPALPSVRDGLTQRMPAGYALKISVIYARPFWREAGLSGLAVCDDGVISETFDNSPPDDSRGVLVAFVYGTEARRLRSEDQSRQRELVLGHLSQLYGPQAREAHDFVTFDWTAEPWTRGCFSGHFAPGGWIGYGPALRQPIGVLHWAGTETAVRWNGYIDGAVESGQRAAVEAISSYTATRGRTAVSL
jgi:monoamine oxidase